MPRHEPAHHVRLKPGTGERDQQLVEIGRTKDIERFDRQAYPYNLVSALGVDRPQDSDVELNT
jgi:hypothetical protein